MAKKNALARPVQPDAVLAEIVGSRPIARTEIVKKIWVYIKKNRLQDPINRRMINADDLLIDLFDGHEQVSMFELAGYISDHVEA